MAIQTAAQRAKDYGGYLQAADSSPRDLGHIPGNFGLPIIGRTYDIMTNLPDLLNEHVNNYGRVSRIGFAFQKGVLVTHPDDLRQIFLDKDRIFSSNMGYKNSLGHFYDGSLITRDFEDHKIQRRIFQSAFKSQALKDYIDFQNPIVKSAIDNWGDKGDIHFVTEIKGILLDIAALIFLGLEDTKGIEAAQLHKAFRDITEQGLMSVFKYDIPGLKYHAGLRGKRYLEQFYRTMIPIRRANPGKDLMSLLVSEKDENGHFWSDDVLIPHLSLLLFAAHDTTAGTLSHTLMHLSKPENLHWQERLREQTIALNKEFPSYEDMEDMEDFENVFNEAMRFHPAVTLIPRRTTQETTLGGQRIPANTILYSFPLYAHTSPEFWNKPDQWDPDRFTAGRKENKSHPFAFLPFGGGSHKCLGMHFAYLNGKIVLHQLLRKYKFELQEGYDCRCNVIPMPFPTKNLPLKITKLSS